MNRRRLLFIGIAAVAVGSLVSLRVYRMLQAQSGPPKYLVDVLVAAHDIPVGAKIEDRDLKITKLPPEDLAADVFHTKGRAVGRGVMLPIAKGDLVLPLQTGGRRRRINPIIPDSDGYARGFRQRE